MTQLSERNDVLISFYPFSVQFTCISFSPCMDLFSSDPSIGCSVHTLALIYIYLAPFTFSCITFHCHCLFNPGHEIRSGRVLFVHM